MRRPDPRLASRIAKASFSVVWGKSEIAGFRMWVVGCPGAGRAICPSTVTTGSFDWAPASDRRGPSSPASNGRHGSLSSTSISAASSSG